MVAQNLIKALRKGAEGEIWWELDLLSRTPRWPRELRAIDDEEAARLLARGDTATQVALSEHPDGRIREAALRALAPEASASLPALLRRANDWVPVVARLAGDRAAALLPQADDATLQSILPLVFALTRQGRVNHAALIDLYLRQTRTRPGLARRIRRAYRNGSVGEWASWRVVGDEETARELHQERLRAGTPRLQLDTARQIAGEPDRWRELLASRSPQVRRVALDHAPPEAVEGALIDENAGVRNDARYLLGKRDYAAHYRALLPVPGAVSGLGEMGSREDALALRPLLLHPKANVRARALDALSRLLGDESEPELFEGLRDPARRVQRTAVDALVRSSVGLDAEETLHLNLPVALRLRLLQRSARWAALIAVLRHVREMPGMEAWLDWWVRTWNGRIAPKAEELEAARKELKAAHGVLDNDLEERLRLALR